MGSKEAILQGLCPDGGLYVSDDMLGTKLDIRAMMLMDYEEIVFTVFRALLTDYSDEELRAYVQTPEPYDKAGGYAIQESFGKYIDHIEGDMDNVIGFPMYRAEDLLR